MLPRVRKIAEVLVIRLTPGLVTVAGIFILSKMLDSVSYGLFSTFFATGTIVSTIIFGPITYSIVSQYSAFKASGDHSAYEWAVSYSTLAIAVAVLVISLPLLLMSKYAVPTALLVASFGAFTTIQEIHRARLNLWLYGASSLLQSAIVIATFLIVVRAQPRADISLLMYAASYIVSTCVAFALLRMGPPRRVNLKILRPALLIGASYSISAICESAISQGIRYWLLWQGNHSALAIFSFSIDLAQRFVGVILNAASFAFVPGAFRLQAQGKSADFDKTLISGTTTAVALSFLSAILVLVALIWVDAKVGKLPLFDPMSFFLVAVAVILNRSKKLGLDPFVVRAGFSRLIAIGYLVASAFVLIVSLVPAPGVKYRGELIYLLGCGLAVVATYALFRRYRPARDGGA